MCKSYVSDSDQLDSLPDEELCRLSAQGVRFAEEALVTRYTRLVRSCARPFFLAGGDSEDLTQEGMLGLIKAVRRRLPSARMPNFVYEAGCIRRSARRRGISICP